MPIDAPWTGGFEAGADRFAVDGDHTIALEVSPPIISYPFESDSHAPDVQTVTLVDGASNPSGFKYELEDPYNLSELNHANTVDFIITQEFSVVADAWEPLPLNTPYDQVSYAPDYDGAHVLSDAILVAESQPQAIGNDQVKWTRTYASVPKSRSTYEDLPFCFPAVGASIIGVPTFDTSGLLPTPQFVPVPLGNGSPPYNNEITARVQHDYFVIPDGAFAIYYAPANRHLPNYRIPQFRVFFGVYANETNQVASSDWVGAFSFANIDGSGAAAPATMSVPPPTNNDNYGLGYNSMVGAQEICVRASVFRPWRGNIMERITYFHVAQ